METGSLLPRVPLTHSELNTDRSATKRATIITYRLAMPFQTMEQRQEKASETKLEKVRVQRRGKASEARLGTVLEGAQDSVVTMVLV